MALRATIPPATWEAIIQAVSFVASIASLIMSFVAIWLSFKFANQSSRDAEKMDDSNRAIQQGVVKLEKMFEMQQSYFFPMLRDIVGKLIMPDTASAEKSVRLVERKVSEKVEQVKTDLKSEVTDLLDKADKSDSSLVEVREELAGVLEKAVDLSREADREAREENVKDRLLNYFNALPPDDTRMMVFVPLVNFRDEFLPLDIFKALNELSREGVVQFDRPINDWQEITSDMTFKYSPRA